MFYCSLENEDHASAEDHEHSIPLSIGTSINGNKQGNRLSAGTLCLCLDNGNSLEQSTNSNRPETNT